MAEIKLLHDRVLSVSDKALIARYGNDKARTRAVARFDAAELGRPPNGAVQYTLAVDVRDDRRRSISAEGTTIAANKAFFTFAELDRGWYKLGDPIQLLLEDSLGERRTIDLIEQSSVIEIPITNKNSPSTWYRASAVRDGKSLKERFDLFVPPVDRLLQVAVEADAREYPPGSEATVRVAVTDDKGSSSKSMGEN